MCPFEHWSPYAHFCAHAAQKAYVIAALYYSGRIEEALTLFSLSLVPGFL